MDSATVFAEGVHAEFRGIAELREQDAENPENGQTVVAVPPHPLGVKPAGNAYTSSFNIKSATGSFAGLPDEIIVQILEYLDASSLLQLEATCKALYAFARFEDLWKSLFLEYVSISLCAC